MLRTNAPTCVEVFWNGLPDGRMFLQLLNLSGFNGVTVEPCIPVPNVEICLPCAVTGVHPLEGAPQPAVEAGGAQTRLRFAPLAALPGLCPGRVSAKTQKCALQRYQAQGAAAFWSEGGGQRLGDGLQGRGLGLGQVEHGPSGKAYAPGQAEHVPAKDAARTLSATR